MLLNWNQLVVGGSLMRLERRILEFRVVILIISNPSIFRHIRNIFIANLVCSNLVQDLLVDTGFVEIYLLSAKGAIGLSFLEGK